MPPTLIDFSQLSKTWKIIAGGGVTLLAVGGIVATLTTKNSSGSITRQEYSDGTSTQSGGLTVGSGALKNKLHNNGLVTFNNVTYRFPYTNGSFTGTTLTNDGAGNLSWSAGVGTGGGGAATGSLITAFDKKYVKKSGDVMTGGLLIVSTAHSPGTIDTGLLLEIGGTASGRIIQAQDRLTSSGVLAVDGNALLNGSSIALGDSISDLVSINGKVNSNIIPESFSAYDIGSKPLRWSNIYGNGGDFDIKMSGALLTVMRGNNYMLGPLTLGALPDVVSEVALEVKGTASGRILHAQDSIESSGSLVIRKVAGTGTGNIFTVDTKGLVYDGTNKRVGIGTKTPTFDLDINKSLPSGTVVLSVRNTDSANASTSALFLGNDTQNYAGQLFMNSSGNTQYGGANSLNLGTLITGPLQFLTDNLRRMIITAAGNVGIGRNNSTPGSILSVSGSVVINPSGKGSMTADAGLSLEVLGTISGSSLTVSGLKSCALVQTDLNGATSCGSAAGGDLSMAFADTRYVRMQGDTMTGGLLIVNGGAGAQTIDAGLMLEIAGTASGRTLHAQDRIESSGSLAIRKLAGTATGNILTIDTAGFVYDATNKRIGIGTSAPATDLELKNRNAVGSATMRIYNPLVSGNAGITFGTSTATNQTQIFTQASGQGDWGGTNSLNIIQGSGPIAFFLDSSAVVGQTPGLIILQKGYVGIDNSLPGSMLTVSGSVLIGNKLSDFAMADTGTLLEVLGTASGKILRAQDQLNSSGSLTVKGSVKLGSGSTIGTTVIGTNTTKVITNSNVTKFSVIQVSILSGSSMASMPFVTSRIPGVSFSIKNPDLSSVFWIGWTLLEPR